MALENKNLISTMFVTAGFEKYSQRILKGNTLIESYVKKSKSAEGNLQKQVIKTSKNIKTGNKSLLSNTTIKETNAKRTKRLAQEQERLNRVASKGKTSMKDLTRAMKRAAIVAPIWMILRGAIQKTLQLFKSSVKFLVDWEKQMAQIKIVGGATAEEYSRLSTSLLGLGKAYGTSLDQLGEGVKLWRQQGRAISEIAPLMKTTIKLSLLTGRTMTETVEDMTAIMKNFGIEANNSRQILDSITNVMLNTAITSDVLVAALKDSASVATLMGVSFDKLNGLIAAMHVSTRAAGGKIGKAWVTIFTRMSTTAVSAIQKIAQVPVYMDATGKSVMRNTGILRPMGQVLDEIAAKWGGLSNELRAQLGLQIAGRRRMGLFSAAMQQYNTGLKATLDSLNSYGKGQRATNVVLETTDAKVKQVINTWKSFVDTIADTRGLKNTLDALKGIIEHMEKMSAFGVSPLSLGLPTTPETGKSFKAALEANKLSEENIILVEKEAADSKTILGLTTDLIQKIKTRNDLLKKGDEASKVGAEGMKEQIDLITEALSEQKGFKELTKLPIDEMLNQLEGMSDKLEEKFIGKEALKNVTKNKEALLGQMRDMQIQYNKLAEKIGIDVPVMDVSATTVNIGKIGLALSKVTQQIKVYKEWSSQTRFEMKEVNQLLASKKILSDLLVKRRELTKLKHDGIKTEFKRLKVEKDAAKLASITQDQQKKYNTELFNLKKKIITEDISEQEAIKLKIALQNEYGESITSLSTMRNAELQSLKSQTELQKRLNKLSVASETDLFRIRGASESQVIKLKMQLEKQLGLNQTIVNKLKNQLDLEKAITQEKKDRLTLSSESLKIAEIVDKFGKEAGRDVLKLLEPESTLDDFKNMSKKIQNIFRKDFESVLKQMWAMEILTKGKGRGLDIQERFRLEKTDDDRVREILRARKDKRLIESDPSKVVSIAKDRSQADIIRAQLKSIIPEAITLPKVDIKAMIENIQINLPENALENTAAEAGRAVIDKLLGDAVLQKRLANLISPLI